jgi:hypothetical protein
MNRQKVTAFVATAIVGVLTGALLVVGRGAPLPDARAADEQANIAVPDSALTGETYVLSGFKLIYPFEAAGLAEADAAWAGVVFTAQWSGDEFPGTADCTVTLRDESGAVVGSRDFHPLYVPTSSENAPLEVAVSAPPATAEGSCEPASGVYAAGPGYTFDLEASEPSATGTRFTFVAHWESEIDPTVRRCTFAVTSEAGDAFEAEIEFMGPDGTEFVQEVPFKAASTPSMTCAEL